VAFILGLLCAAQRASISLSSFIFETMLTALGIILALAYADLGKPRLNLEPDGPNPVRINGTEQTLFLNVRVFNRPFTLPPFVARRTAISCRGTISIMDSNSNRVFDMRIRWSSNPQPIHPVGLVNTIQEALDRNLIRPSELIDIPADESELLDICFRNPLQAAAHGWNSENYFYNNSRHPERNLPTGDYVVRVDVKHNDGAASRTFLLHNPDDLAGFLLAEFR
jgi:hypothetical protein